MVMLPIVDIPLAPFDIASYDVNAGICVNGIARRACGGDIERAGAIFLAVDAQSSSITANNSVGIATGNGEGLAVGEDEVEVAIATDLFA